MLSESQMFIKSHPSAYLVTAHARCVDCQNLKPELLLTVVSTPDDGYDQSYLPSMIYATMLFQENHAQVLVACYLVAHYPFSQLKQSKLQIKNMHKQVKTSIT
jgi:hypothetical protein